MAENGNGWNWVAGFSPRAKQIIAMGCGDRCTTQEPLEVVDGWDIGQEHQLFQYRFSDQQVVWEFVQTIRSPWGDNPGYHPVIFLGLTSGQGVIFDSLWTNEEMNAFMEEVRKGRA